MEIKTIDEMLENGNYHLFEVVAFLEGLSGEEQLASFRKVVEKQPYDMDIIHAMRSLSDENQVEAYQEVLEALHMPMSKINCIRDHAPNAEQAKEDFFVVMAKEIDDRKDKKTPQEVAKCFLKAISDARKMAKMLPTIPDCTLAKRYLDTSHSGDIMVKLLLKQIADRITSGRIVLDDDSSVGESTGPALHIKEDAPQAEQLTH